jgi:hypothetical protein
VSQNRWSFDFAACLIRDQQASVLSKYIFFDELPLHDELLDRASNGIGSLKGVAPLQKHPRLAFSEAISPGDWPYGTRAVNRTSYSAADLSIHTVVPVPSSRYVSTKVRSLIHRLTTEFGESPPWDRWLQDRG